MKYNRESIADQVFLLTHTRRVKKRKNVHGENEDDEDGEDSADSGYEWIWVDKKSQQTYVSYLNFYKYEVFLYACWKTNSLIVLESF